MLKNSIIFDLFDFYDLLKLNLNYFNDLRSLQFFNAFHPIKSSFIYLTSVRPNKFRRDKRKLRLADLFNCET